jgi:hypothetical protein
MSPLTPQRLAGKSLREIDGVELQTTRRAVRVGDLFTPRTEAPSTS